MDKQRFSEACAAAAQAERASGGIGALRHIGAIHVVGKERNAFVYE